MTHPTATSCQLGVQGLLWNAGARTSAKTRERPCKQGFDWSVVNTICALSLSLFIFGFDFNEFAAASSSLSQF